MERRPFLLTASKGVRQSFVRDLAVACFLVALGTSLSIQTWRTPVSWTPDGLHYQSALLQIRGVAERNAIRDAFTGPTASRLLASDESKERLRDLDLVQATERFYERRRLLPWVGAAIYPVLGERSLQAVSIVAYIALGPILYLLLRRRASWWAAGGVAALVMLTQPVRTWSFFPLTDSTGLLLMLVAGGAAISVLEGRSRWLVAWCLALAGLSFTREVWVACLVAAGAVVVRDVRRSLLLLATGAAAVLPALVLYDVPTRYYMDCTFNLSDCSEDNGWAHALSGYPGSLWRMLENDALSHTMMAAWVVGGALLLFLRTSRDDVYFLFWRGAFVGGLVMLALLPNATDFRLELVLLPSAAVGTAAYLSSDSLRRVTRRYLSWMPRFGQPRT